MGMNIIAIIFVFSVLVIIHELGHFMAAKLMGVRVEKFSIGFPPKLFGKKWGDTEYCISAIPLGGYVKMSGMLDESLDTETTGAAYEFNSKPVWKRMVIIFAGVLMNFILAVVILTTLNYVKGETILPGTEIGGVGQDGVVQKIGLKKGDIIKSINGVKVNSWNELQHQFLNNLNQDIVFSIVRDSARLELYYNQEWFSEERGELIDIAWMPSARAGNIRPDMPAYEIGLKKGDLITEIEGEPIHNWMDLRNIISVHAGDSISISWRRGDRNYNAIIVPAEFDEGTDSLGNVIKTGKIGIEYYIEYKPVTLVNATMNGFSSAINLIALNTRALWWVISGTKSAKDIIGGPIMIAKLAGDAAEAGWEQLWYFIAALSAILAFFNILPIPALDGGHFVLLGIEAIIRRPLSVKTKLTIQQIGMAILITFIIFVLYIDVKKLF
jgi:regulator of sigma E protease